MGAFIYYLFINFSNFPKCVVVRIFAFWSSVIKIYLSQSHKLEYVVKILA